MTQVELRPNKWLVRYGARGRVKRRLLCFPFAGGDAQLFRGWQSRLPADTEVWAMQAPGRRERLAEEPIADLKALVLALVESVQRLADLPLFFYGHSNGALLAFELARELQRRGVMTLSHLFVSARKSPLLPPRANPYHQMPDAELIRAVQGIGGLPNGIQHDKELQQVLLPALRADFALGEAYQYEDDVLLNCPASLLFGTRDRLATLEAMQGWRKVVAEKVSIKAIPGGHFFMVSQEAFVLREVNRVLTEVAVA